MSYNNNDLFDKSTKWKILGGVTGAVLGGAIVIGLVIYMNESTKGSPKEHLIDKHVKTEAEYLEEEKENVSIENSGLTSKDLDFWNAYDDEETESIIDSSSFDKKSSVQSKNNDNKSSVSTNKISGNGIKGSDETNKSNNQFNIGTGDEEEYIDISSEIPINNYQPGSFRLEGQNLSYYSNNRKISSMGIDISKYQGNIDWDKVSESGIDFAMIRMGVRGYSSGQVVVDENFTNNIIGAISHGIDVGIYFYSQATTVAEAVEEANYAVASVQGYAISYPIAFYTETITNEPARTDDLTLEEMTEIAKAFCQTVEAYGYKSLICGPKSQLVKKLDLNALNDKSIFLIDPIAKGNDEALAMSDYPYRYSMWQYSNVGEIDGIDGDVNLDISFVDYKYR